MNLGRVRGFWFHCSYIDPRLFDQILVGSVLRPVNDTRKDSPKSYYSLGVGGQPPNNMYSLVYNVAHRDDGIGVDCSGLFIRTRFSDGYRGSDISLTGSCCWVILFRYDLPLKNWVGVEERNPRG